MKQFFNFENIIDILIKLLLFLLGFAIGSDLISAKASTTEVVNAYLPQSFESGTDSSDIRDYLDPIEDVLKSTGKYYAIILSARNPNSSSSTVDSNTLLRNFSIANIYIFDSPIVLSGWGSDFSFKNESGTNFTYYTYTPSSIPPFSSDKIDMFTTYKEAVLDYANAFRKVTSTYASGINFPSTVSFSSPQRVLYSTNFDCKLNSYRASTDVYYSYKVNDTVYTHNQAFPTLKQVLKTPYAENFKQSVSGIDRVEYTFDVLNTERYSFEFNFSATLHSVTNKTKFKRPYMLYTHNETQEFLYFDKFTENDNEKIYNDTQINIFEPNSTIKFIVDFTNVNEESQEDYVFIHFDSQYPFTRRVVTVAENDPIVTPDTPPKDDGVKDFLEDDTPPDVDISGLGDIGGLLPPGPVDSLLNIPLKFLNITVDSFGGKCVPLSGTFVYDSTLTLPCFNEIIYDEVPDYLLNFISLIPSAFILIKYFKHLYKKVDRATSMNSNSDDEWGVL